MEQKRFIQVGVCENKWWIKECPVKLNQTTIEKDTLTGNIHLKFLFYNNYHDAIKTIYLNIYCYDDCGDKLGEALDEAVQGKKPEAQASFKTTTPVVLPYKNTTFVEVEFVKILFTNGDIWRYTEDMKKIPLPEIKKIHESDELYRQIARECLSNGIEMVCYPQDFDDFWLCSCGEINDGESCCSCGADHQWLKDHFDKEYLQKKNLEYQEEERRRVEEQKKIIEEQERRIKEEAAEKIYSQGESFLSKEKLKPSDYINASAAFKSISDYKDAAARAEECENKAKELEAAKEANKKKRIKIAGISIVAIVLLAALTYGSIVYFIPEGKYFIAGMCRKGHKYDTAVSLYESLEDYKDSYKLIKKTKYEKGLYLIEQGEYAEAIEVLGKLINYEDSKEKIKESHYLYGKELYEGKEYLKAAEEFSSSEGYEDSSALCKECRYLGAKELYAEGKYIEAADLFKKAGEYEDSQELQREARYKGALEYYEAKDYLEAYKQFGKITDYKDSKTYYQESCYLHAEDLYNNKEYAYAVSYYRRLKDYKDSEKKYKACRYARGCEFLEDDDYINAVGAFEDAKGYKDADTKKKEAMYAYVINNKNNYDETTLEYLKALKSSGYKDSKKIYNSLYAWKVSIVINDSEDDDDTDKYSISKYKTIYCHISLSGGEPGESIRLKYTGYFPNGSRYSDSWDGSWSDGYSGTCYFWYERPYYGTTGTFTLKIFDSSGNLLGSDSIMMTN